jgi:protocatechuate 3,4-dioxygenase beta subunit
LWAGVFAEELARTPRMTEGPFYPDKLPLDTDNDLIVINKALTPAVGEITHLGGRILGTSGEPIKDAMIEIWQCDANAVYLHTRDSGSKQKQQDKNFQGYGRFTTDAKGGYRFHHRRCRIPAGLPHIHFKVTKGGRELLTSQIFVSGHPGNKNDGVFGGIRDPFEPRAVPRRFQADQGFQGGRAVGLVRHRDRSHSRGARPKRASRGQRIHDIPNPIRRI